MKKSSKILIAVLVVVILIIGVVVYGPMFYTGNSVYQTGIITYKPIDELPSGASAIVLTEEDFEQHPAFSSIFTGDTQTRSVGLTMDKEATEIPNPCISEHEGYDIMENYPYVEYEGELYVCYIEIS